MDRIGTARYQRHELIDWFSQQRLADSRVAVIGAGAIGNEVIKNLVLLGTGAWTCSISTGSRSTT